MPLPRFQRLAADKRNLLLQVAAAEFAAKGFEGASLNEILAAAGLGKSSYYYYFADKEDLYASCLEDAIARLRPELPDFSIADLDANNFWPTLEAYAGEVIALAARHLPALALFRHMQPMWRAPTPRFEALAQHVAAPFFKVIQIGRDLGCVRTDLEIGRLIALVRAADAALDESFLARSTITPAELKEHGRLVIDTMRRLLVPAVPSPKKKGR